MPWSQKGWDCPKNKVLQLQKLSLFKSQSEDDLDFLAAEMRIFTDPVGHTMASKHESGSAMFMLTEGMMGVLITLEGNAPFKVANLEPGDFFGGDPCSPVSHARRQSSAPLNRLLVKLQKMLSLV